MTSLRVVTEPATEPVSIETLKNFLRVDINDDDALIAGLARSARIKGEDLARRAFVTQTLEMIIDDWPPKFVLALMRPPLQSVTSVKYYNRSNQEFSWTDFVVDNRSEPGRIHFNSVPGTELLFSGGIVVRYVAGYGTDASVPQTIKDAILALTAHWYENRDQHHVPREIQTAFLDERATWF